MERQRIKQNSYLKLAFSVIIVSLLSTLLTFLLKHLTEFFEFKIFSIVNNFNPLFFLLLPSVGITLIYYLRKFLFKNRKNKGITEIYKTIDQRKDHLPLFKVPSHFINGLLTVSFGGSTGIEVSSVVASAAIGNGIYENDFSVNKYKKELICAGVTAAVAILFTNPLAGILFSLEVIARKVNKSILFSCILSAFVVWGFILISKEPPLFSYKIIGWSYYAVPFFLILSLLGSLVSVYFTLLVTRMKRWFSNISSDFLRVNIGAILIGFMILYFPSLYGDSYHGLNEILELNSTQQSVSIVLLLMLVLLKPLAASLTLGAGGDGGVFAPSIVVGAFLGLYLAYFLNSNLGTNLVPLNFAIVGAGCVLSASLHAPFTSIVLVCGIIPNGIQLFIPLLICCLLAKVIAKKLLPYNAYTYDAYVNSIPTSKSSL